MTLGLWTDQSFVSGVFIKYNISLIHDFLKKLVNKQNVISNNLGVARIVMVIAVGNGDGDRSSNPGWGCLVFSHSTNTFVKSMTPPILSPVKG